MRNGATRHGKVSKGGATDRVESPAFLPRDRSPASVIVMRAWLALAGVLPAALVFKRSCLPLPRQAKARQDGWGTGNRQPEIVAGADSRLPCPASGGISAVKRKVKKKNG